jgi:hypothetical protein
MRFAIRLNAFLGGANLVLFVFGGHHWYSALTAAVCTALGFLAKEKQECQQ